MYFMCASSFLSFTVCLVFILSWYMEILSWPKRDFHIPFLDGFVDGYEKENGSWTHEVLVQLLGCDVSEELATEACYEDEVVV